MLRSNSKHGTFGGWFFSSPKIAMMYSIEGSKVMKSFSSYIVLDSSEYLFYNFVGNIVQFGLAEVLRAWEILMAILESSLEHESNHLQILAHSCIVTAWVWILDLHLEFLYSGRYIEKSSEFSSKRHFWVFIADASPNIKALCRPFGSELRCARWTYHCLTCHVSTFPGQSNRTRMLLICFLNRQEGCLYLVSKSLNSHHWSSLFGFSHTNVRSWIEKNADCRQTNHIRGPFALFC